MLLRLPPLAFGEAVDFEDGDSDWSGIKSKKMVKLKVAKGQSGKNPDSWQVNRRKIV